LDIAAPNAMRRTDNAIFVGACVQPPVPMIGRLDRSRSTVLRTEPNAISIWA